MSYRTRHPFNEDGRVPSEMIANYCIDPVLKMGDVLSVERWYVKVCLMVAS